MTTQSRRERERANIREEILDAARNLFVKNGYDRVSVRQIAQKIDYAPGTIYLYFKDKEDIFRTICNETFSKLHTRLSAIVADQCPPLEKVRRAGFSYIQFALDNPSHYMLLFMTRENPMMAGDIADYDIGESCFRDLCHMVQQCVEADLLRSDDVQQVSQTLWSCVHGVSALLIAKCGFPFIEQHRLIEAVLDTILHGIVKPQ